MQVKFYIFTGCKTFFRNQLLANFIFEYYVHLKALGCCMGINKQSNIEANLQIGPTDIGMVRIYVSAGGTEIPMDFDPEEADEISEEIRLAAEAARKLTK